MASLREESSVLLKRLGVCARKKLGQNFMVDETALQAISQASAIQEGEAIVEIGPGLGFLTRCLLGRGAHVFAAEKDAAYARFLRDYFKGRRFDLLEKDVLEIQLLPWLGRGPVKIFGNIPYNITTPILEWMIDQKKQIGEAVLTVQWEVARRLCAGPGGKDWGTLSVFLRYHAQTHFIKKISRESFLPAPKVESAVIKICFLEKPAVDVRDEILFFKIVRHAFQQRRKTLLNALSAHEDIVSKQALAGILERVGIESRRRPETISLEEWALISNSISG